MPNQNPDDPSGANPMGRWDYGPWFWPPFTGQTFGPVPNPLFDPVNAPWEGSQNPGTENPSIVPEAFMDTPVVNGTAYPVLNVDPKAYRFRVLNAANDRFWNLSLWQAASQNAMWNADGTLADGMAGEVSSVPFNSSQNKLTPFPTSWYDGSVTNPFDDRVGGVPDPTTAGPQMVQIGNEAGMLPGTAPIENRPINYVMNKRDITVGNIAQKALFLGPAERADVVVDFSQFAGKTLILYNDSPAPVPAADPRHDYFTGASDQTATGGAPTTLPGYGPNTRTIMMIKVAPSTPAPAFDQAKLDTALPTAYAASQRKPLVPEPAYNAAFGATFPNALVRIQDTSLSFANGLYGLTDLRLTSGGSGYAAAPNVTIAGGGGSGATATATLGPSVITALNLTNGGSGYTAAPNVAIAGGGGSGGTDDRGAGRGGLGEGRHARQPGLQLHVGAHRRLHRRRRFRRDRNRDRLEPADRLHHRHERRQRLHVRSGGVVRRRRRYGCDRDRNARLQGREPQRDERRQRLHVRSGRLVLGRRRNGCCCNGDDRSYGREPDADQRRLQLPVGADRHHRSARERNAGDGDGEHRCRSRSRAEVDHRGLRPRLRTHERHARRRDPEDDGDDPDVDPVSGRRSADRGDQELAPDAADRRTRRWHADLEDHPQRRRHARDALAHVRRAGDQQGRLGRRDPPA